MINDGCGLCLLLFEHKSGRNLYVKCDLQESGNVTVRNCPQPFVVATPDTPTSWTWGHYFANFDQAYEYLMKGEI